MTGEGLCSLPPIPRISWYVFVLRSLTEHAWIFISMSVLSVTLPLSLILHTAAPSSLSFRILVTRRFIFSVWPAVSLWSQALAHFGSQLVSFHCIMSSSVPHVFSPAVSHDLFGPFRFLRLHFAHNCARNCFAILLVCRYPRPLWESFSILVDLSS